MHLPKIATARKMELAQTSAQNIAPIIENIDRAGVTTLSGIAKALEARSVKTPSGNDNWTPTQVARIKQRAVG